MGRRKLDAEWGEGGRGGWGWSSGSSKKYQRSSSKIRRRGTVQADGTELLQCPSLQGPESPLGPPDTTLETSAITSESENEHCMQFIKVILLGAPAVGKTSIIQQFVWNEFSEHYSPTARRNMYHPTVILNDRLYELRLSDIPVISYFPLDSFAEWADFRYYGLRSATAYVLVYDLSNAETFQYIRTIREQMAESRDMRNVPVLVVGNKQDLVMTESGPYHHAGSSSGYNPAATAHSAVCLMEQGIATQQAQHKFAGDYAREKRDIVNFVKKHWKCGYVECSAKYNWKIMSLFKELTIAIDLLTRASGTGTGALGGSSSKDHTAHPIDNFHDGNKCIIL
ncbi:hypothetical protein B566_EDAN013723 [Ephemera danica]|nr:hypothetical protein B566_EDAN013723 [Ephemera danica]